MGNELDQNGDYQEVIAVKKEDYIERSAIRDQETSEEIRFYVSSLSRLKNEFANLDSLNYTKAAELSVKANELSEVKSKFKTLLSHSDSGISQRVEALDLKLEELEDLMLKKKNAKSALYRLDSDLSSTQLANKYLELENEISNMNLNAESVNKNYIIEAKARLLNQISERVTGITQTVHKLKEHARKVVKQQDEAGKGIKFISENQTLGKVYRFILCSRRYTN